MSGRTGWAYRLYCLVAGTLRAKRKLQGRSCRTWWLSIPRVLAVPLDRLVSMHTTPLRYHGITDVEGNAPRHQTIDGNLPFNLQHNAFISEMLQGSWDIGMFSVQMRQEYD